MVAVQRTPRHAGVHGFTKLLHDTDAACRFDSAEPVRPVAVPAGQHHADDARPVNLGGRLEQNVRGRPRVMNLRPGPEADETLVDHDCVPIGRCEQDVPREDVAALLGIFH